MAGRPIYSKRCPAALEVVQENSQESVEAAQALAEAEFSDQEFSEPACWRPWQV